VLQKSKIEELRKSRERRLFDVFVVVGPCRIDTAAGGRFGAKRCGPSRRRVQNAPASLKNFIGQSKKGFFNTICQYRKLVIRTNDLTELSPLDGVA
jgi:hypothetical protein